MATLDLFRPQSEDVVRGSLRMAKAQARERTEDEFDLAIDYLEGRQIEDTRSELNSRHQNAQNGSRGEIIHPVIVPLTERYVNEAANAYNRPVKRELVNEDGTVNDEATKALTDELKACGYDEIQHRREKIEILVGTCGQWYQAKRGQLKPRIVLPQRIHPVLPEDSRFADPADQEDYLGYVVDLINDADDTGSSKPKQFAMLTRSEHMYFEGRGWSEFLGRMERHKNPFTWPQAPDSDDGKSQPDDLPLQMLTIWHRSMPCDELVIDTDADIVYLNRELNIQWSVLLHTVRIQGHAQMVMNLTDPDSPPARVAYGPMFALPLGPGESAGYVSATTNYSEMVEVLKAVTKMMAISKRMSPNDFAFDGPGPQSGFAKLVESLPKIEAREDRIARLTRMEEQIAWPRIGAVMRYLGKLPSAEKFSMKVEFSKIEFPRSVQERTQEEEHDFKHGLSEPAEILAQRKGITVDEAREIVGERKAAQAEQQAQNMPAQQAPLGSLFGDLARRKSSKEDMPAHGGRR